MSVEDFLVRYLERTGFCRDRGNWLRDAGILDNDMLVVERNAAMRPGDIVAAVVDNEVTVQYLHVNGEGWVLRALYPAYEDIKAKSTLEMLGAFVGVFRRLTG